MEALAVQSKYADLARSFQSRKEEVEAVQKRAINDVLPDVVQQLELQQEGKNRALAFLEDTGTVFRFYRRSRYDEDATLALLSATLLWRLRTDLDQLSLSSLHPLYVNPPTHPPLFWLNSRFKDRFGRPCALISLRSLERTGDQTLEEIKEYIVFSMELARRLLADWFAQKTVTAASNSDHLDLDDESDEGIQKLSEATPPLQMTIAFDLAKSGMANLELELLPFLLDLLKNHFPGMVGAVYMLHYGWVHAGMWTIAKRVLPQQALARIFFPKDQQLLEHFPAANLPCTLSDHGELEVTIDAKSSDVARKFGKRRRANPRSGGAGDTRSPADSPMMERNKPLSRSASFESIYEVFYSADATPWASRPITPRGSQPGTPRGEDSPRRGAMPSSSSSSSGNFHMTPSAARKLRDLQMTRGAPAMHSSDLSATAEARDYYYARRRANSAASITGGALPYTANAPYAASASQDPFALANGGLTPQARMSPATTPRYGRSPSLGFAQLHSVTTPGAGASSEMVPAGASLSRPTSQSLRFQRDRSRSRSPSRIGAMRDFRLHLPRAPRDAAEAAARIALDGATSESDGAAEEYGSAGGESGSGEDEDGEESGSGGEGGSEKSGKAGEKKVSPGTGAGSRSGGFFSRWTKGASVTSPTTPTAPASQRPVSQLRRESTEDEKAYRARLREQQREQSQGGSGEAKPQAQAEAPFTKPQRLSSAGPSSPKFQVALLEEPPIAPVPSSSGLTGPMRYLSQRSRKYANVPGVVSPYNSTNPFYGYPAIVTSHPSSNAYPNAPSAPRRYYSYSPGTATSSVFPHHQHLHARRRKRDLVRTLSYLFVLRILAAHRQVRWKVSLLWREMGRVLRMSGGAGTEEGEEWALREARRKGRRKSLAAVGRESEEKARTGRWVLLLLVLLVLGRSKWRAKVLEMARNSWVASAGVLGALGVKDAEGDGLELATAAEGESAVRSLSGLHVRRRLGIQ